MSEYNCVICNEPVSLNETKADETGQCVHGDCYFKKLTGRSSRSNYEADSQQIAN
jgi:hypothetical protein